MHDVQGNQGGERSCWPDDPPRKAKASCLSDSLPIWLDCRLREVIWGNMEFLHSWMDPCLPQQWNLASRWILQSTKRCKVAGNNNTLCWMSFWNLGTTRCFLRIFKKWTDVEFIVYVLRILCTVSVLGFRSEVIFLACRCCLIAFRCYVCSRVTARNHVCDFALLLFEGLNTGELIM